MPTTLDHQVDEQRQGLARPKGDHLPGMPNLWCAEEGEIQLAHRVYAPVYARSTLLWYL